jgi:hypothetical protein
MEVQFQYHRTLLGDIGGDSVSIIQANAYVIERLQNMNVCFRSCYAVCKEARKLSARREVCCYVLNQCSYEVWCVVHAT